MKAPKRKKYGSAVAAVGAIMESLVAAARSSVEEMPSL